LLDRALRAAQDLGMPAEAGRVLRLEASLPGTSPTTRDRLLAEAERVAEQAVSKSPDSPGGAGPESSTPVT